MTRFFLSMTSTLGAAGYVGVMLCIGIGLGGYWLGMDPPGGFATLFEGLFPFLAPNVAFTLLPSLVATVVLLVRSWRDPASRNRWAVALGLLVLSVAVTVAYHVPANFRIWSGELAPELLTSELHWWLGMHAVRAAAALGGAVAAFWASSLPVVES
jgi:hypothetical protein